MQLDTMTYRKDLHWPVGHGYGPVREGGPSTRDVRDIRLLLIHTTNNPNGNTNYIPEAVFLRDSQAVSTHYIVSSHDDTVVQSLPDEWIAWHAGDCIDPDAENPHSIGIEIAWANNKGPLPQRAIATTTDLVRSLLKRYPWITKIDTHRHQAPTRKIDPSGWSDAAFNSWRAALLVSPPPPPPVPTSARYTADSPLLLATIAFTNPQRAVDLIAPRTTQYNRDQVTDTVAHYWRIAPEVGLDPVLVLAQMCHETGYLCSWWSEAPRHNPAGLGVTGRTNPSPPDRRPAAGGGEYWAYNYVARRWEMGLSFPDWPTAIRAHCGRLLAYCLRDDQTTPAQRPLIAEALRWRALPVQLRGSVSSLRELGAAHNKVNAGKAAKEWLGWATPGLDYGAKIAAIANALVTQ